jgi:predicted Ser/Thr protein kinase
MSGHSAPRRIGPYEVVAPLGSGGMGEVYRARDARLGREVALKLLPEEFATDRERLRRFEQEARSASALNHPNIVTIYEVGTEGAAPYIAMELIEGRTLRELMRSGPIPTRRMLEIAAQVANGLAAAHEAGISHRDIKPENVMIAREGIVKILDFGLAKRVFSPGADGKEPTEPFLTAPGAVVGTVRYMSPEQAAGRPVDFRTDQFSFASLLYEMATGKPAFSGETNVDTLSAILHAEPEPAGRVNPTVPPPLGWIIERCLAKDPNDRYTATRDLSRDLATLGQHMSEVSLADMELAPRGSRRRIPAVAIGLAVVGALVVGILVGRSGGSAAQPRFRQLTFQGAGISTARFSPDGQTVVYSAQWEGRRPELFETRLDHPESRSLGLPSAQILSISASGEMAILLLPPYGMTLRTPHTDLVERHPRFLFGTLAEVALIGGAPRERLEDVFFADWAPNGKDLLVQRFVKGFNRLELPVGKLLYESHGWFNQPRVSPRGDRVAFADMLGNLLVCDLSGHVKPTGKDGWEHAWSPVTGELWYVPSGTGGTTELRAIGFGEKDRLVAPLAGDFALHDISASGRVLLGRVTQTAEIFGSFPGEARDRYLSNFDRSVLTDVSASGEAMTFSELGVAGDEQPTAYLRRTDGSPAKRLGALGGYDGAMLSPDGRFVLGAKGDALILVPTGAGEVVSISTQGVGPERVTGFFPDGKTVYFVGKLPGRTSRIWILDLAGGEPRPIAPEGARRPSLSGDGRFLCAIDAEENWNLYPTAGGEAHKVEGLFPGEEPIQWTADGKWLYVRGADELKPGEPFITARFYRLDPWTGLRKLWKEIPPVSPTTGGGIGKTLFAADGKICIYTHHRYTAELFVAEGLR